MKVINLVILIFISLVFADPYLDVASVSIDMDSIIPESTSVTPMATVINNGTETVSFDVECMIYSTNGPPPLYEETQVVVNLDHGENVQVVFTPDFNFAIGTYMIKVYTLLDHDGNPHNDTLVKFINTISGIENRTTGVGFTFKAPVIVKGKANLEINLPRMSTVVLMVYDILGGCHSIINQKLEAGNYSFSVDLNLPMGTYFYNLETEFGNQVQKFLIIE